jgi:hypothetical protein
MDKTGTLFSVLLAVCRAGSCGLRAGYRKLSTGNGGLMEICIIICIVISCIYIMCIKLYLQ